MAETGRGSGGAAPRLGLAFLMALLCVLFLRSELVDLAVARGDSMLPGIRDGEILLVFKAAYGLRNPLGGYLFLWARPKNRDLVAALRPGEPRGIVKRVSGERAGAAPGDPVFLLGDNIYASVDSREFGPVPMNSVLGKVFPILGP